MTLVLLVAASVGTFGLVWCWFVAAVLSEIETERTDLARDASRCTRRYQR